MDGVMLAWLVEVGIIAARDLTGPKRPPLPSELLASFVIFGGLGVVSASTTARRPAAAVAWGIVVATLLASKVDFLRPVGNFLTGSPGGSTTATPGPGPAPAPGIPTGASSPGGAVSARPGQQP